MSSVDVSEAGANVDLMSQSALRKKFPWLAVDDVELASYGQSSTRCGHCRKGNINKNCLYVTVLCTIIMVHKDTSSSYRSVDCISQALILLGLALCLPSASVSSVLMVLYRY